MMLRVVVLLSSLLRLLLLVDESHAFTTTATTATSTTQPPSASGVTTTRHRPSLSIAVPPLCAVGRSGGGNGLGGLSEREREIKRKISSLKKEGRLRKNNKYEDMDDDDDDIDDDDDEAEIDQAMASMLGTSSSSRRVLADDVTYESKIREKLGNVNSQQLLGFSSSGSSSKQGGSDKVDVSATRISGALAMEGDEVERSVDSFEIQQTFERKPIINPDLFDDDDDNKNNSSNKDEVAEQDLLDLVALKMTEKREQERREEEDRVNEISRQKLAELEQEQQMITVTATTGQQLTTGVGGSWTKNNNNETQQLEYYKPKSGSWGAFPRPKDISRAYGGGRRIGPGFSDEAERLKSEEETRARLQQYRERVGIEVPTEKEHAGEIDAALEIATLAMQRGRYAAGVSALEKVSKYCSSNSKVGGKVFLELAMAYEAVGRTDEAITVYRTLSNSRIEDVKFNAKRLLYGIEAMQFMQNDVKSPEFSRRRARNTFIDTTGFGNIASHFDDVYQTAYVDLKGGFYKKLTESVVRSNREARQVLLRATSAGDVPRLRVVQALRSLSRSFDDALEIEIKINAPVPEPVAVINGVPIRPSPSQASSRSDDLSRLAMKDQFVLTDADSMMANLDGEWKLQLLADKRGDGVKFFDSTVSWQTVNVLNMTFSSFGPSGFSSIQQAGEIEFNEKRRILRRNGVQPTSGGGLFSGLIMGSNSGFSVAVLNPQQIVSVDSVLLITRGIPSKRVRKGDDEKDYFAVWRRVERGTYSMGGRQK